MAVKAENLHKQKRYQEALYAYEELLEAYQSSLDKAKTLANIAQVLEKLGRLDEAVLRAQQALDIVDEQELHNVSEGIFLRGFLNGFINRHTGKSMWAGREYNESIPLEMNLTLPQRLRSHLALAIIGGAIARAIISQIPLPQLEVVINLFNTQVTLFEVVGMIIGAIATNKMVETMTFSLRVWGGWSIKTCLDASINILTLVAIIYLVISPILLNELSQALIWIVLGGILAIIWIALEIRRY